MMRWEDQIDAELNRERSEQRVDAPGWVVIVIALLCLLPGLVLVVTGIVRAL